MKKAKLFLVALLFVTVAAEAQNQTYTQEFDSLFSNVGYSGISSGILYDRVADFSNLENFNRQLTDTGSCYHVIQAYSLIIS